ncbi:MULTISPECIES: helix-turn-helix domain-containing protein [Arthrobacter]|uniref:XRE family transcriptional regulator n=1 Tax=Arthrobacter terricola TaxID=2547396 RepID=A0A4R5KD65_9MICC|nr:MULTISPECIES: helix-turn-helix transcriptional regulator [Arthrobacter]MBT8162727.1 helix-turn-helix transcriptional regulator [Arthrobacter sp. GN70]TDF92107.1 XRE family transcriptional regulator [Arthrobacter terricola]
MVHSGERLRGHDIGPTGKTVARNLKRLRGNITLRELQQRLRGVGHEISASGIQKIEAGVRRVDVDDLVALAVVLGVNPNALLFPKSLDEPVAVTGADPADLMKVWEWADGITPIDSGVRSDDYVLGIRPDFVQAGNTKISTLTFKGLNSRVDELEAIIKTLVDQNAAKEQSGDGND